MSEKDTGTRAMSDESRRQLRSFLLSLKAGSRLSPTLIGEDSDLMRLLGKCFGVTSAAAAYELIRTALEPMDSNELHVQALLNAYGAEGLPSDIMGRRMKFEKERGLTPAELHNLESRAVAELVEILTRDDTRPPTSEPSIPGF